MKCSRAVERLGLPCARNKESPLRDAATVGSARPRAADVYFSCAGILAYHKYNTILMEGDRPAAEGVGSDILQQMQLFDLSQPKEIITFIVDEREGIDDHRVQSTRPCPLSKKRKLYNNKAQAKNPTQDQNKENARSRSIGVNAAISPTAQDSAPPTPPGAREAGNVSMVPWPALAQDTSQTARDWPVRRANVPRACWGRYGQELAHGPRADDPSPETLLIGVIVDYLTCQTWERKHQLFVRTYDYIVQHFLRANLGFNVLIPKISSYAYTHSMIVDHNQIYKLLDELFAWCRMRRTSMPNFYPPPYKNDYYATPHRSPSAPLLVHTPRNSMKRPQKKKGTQPSYPFVYAVRKDPPSAFRLGPSGEVLNANVNYPPHRELQSKPELNQHNVVKNVNFHETPRLHDVVIKPKGTACREVITKKTNDAEIRIMSKDTFQNVNRPTDPNLEIAKESDGPALDPELERNNRPAHGRGPCEAASPEAKRSAVSRDGESTSPCESSSVQDQHRVSPARPPAHKEVAPTAAAAAESGDSTLRPRGVCRICKHITDKLCVGCHKTYYCSPECQESERHIHKIFCY